MSIITIVPSNALVQTVLEASEDGVTDKGIILDLITDPLVIRVYFECDPAIVSKAREILDSFFDLVMYKELKGGETDG